MMVPGLASVSSLTTQYVVDDGLRFPFWVVSENTLTLISAALIVGYVLAIRRGRPVNLVGLVMVQFAVGAWNLFFVGMVHAEPYHEFEEVPADWLPTVVLAFRVTVAITVVACLSVVVAHRLMVWARARADT